MKNSKEIRKAKRARLQAFADKLNSNLPRSEKWFNSLYFNFKHKGDKFNLPWQGFIPDVINHKLKYIIEIDGSIHDLPEIKIKDGLKDKKFHRYNYQVYRIEAYNKQSFNEAMEALVLYRNTSNDPIHIPKESKMYWKNPNNPRYRKLGPIKTILRKKSA